MSRRFDFINSNNRSACEQGSTFISSVYLKGPYKEAIDLTGYSAKLQVRSTAASSTVILEISTSNGYISTLTTAGKISWTVPASITAALTAGQYYYDLEITSAGGVIKRVIEGRFDITAEITR